jgi:hypothetical protein
MYLVTYLSFLPKINGLGLLITKQYIEYMLGSMGTKGGTINYTTLDMV